MTPPTVCKSLQFYQGGEGDELSYKIGYAEGKGKIQSASENSHWQHKQSMPPAVLALSLTSGLGRRRPVHFLKIH